VNYDTLLDCDLSLTQNYCMHSGHLEYIGLLWSLFIYLTSPGFVQFCYMKQKVLLGYSIYVAQKIMSIWI